MRLVELIETRREEVLTRWVHRVRERPGWEDVSLEAQRQPLADVLGEVVALLDRPSEEPVHRGPGTRAHGAQRARLGVALPALVAEYPLLARVLHELAEEQGLVASWAEVGALADVMSRTLASATREYAHEQALQRLALEQRRTRLDTLLLQAPVAIAILRGPELVVELANALACQMVGREHSAVFSRPLLEALPELVGQGFEEIMRRVMLTGESFVGTELPVPLVRTPGGAPELAYVNVVNTALRDGHDALEGLMLVATDVTELVQARQEAQRRAEEERRLRDFEQHLLGIVSHDLRNPLHAVLMAVSLLRGRHPGEARLRQSLDLIQLGAQRSLRLVHDLLDFTQSRLGGGLRITRGPVDLHEVARAAVTELRVTHPGRQLWRVQRGDARGQWDGDRLAQVVDNLVGNAFQYSPPDSAVTVRTVGDGRDVLLEVHNEGPPIPAELLPRLFEPLRRGDGQADPGSRSVGLGLYIVDQIVRAHGGGVHVTSRASEGTTFQVLLPRQP